MNEAIARIMNEVIDSLECGVGNMANACMIYMCVVGCVWGVGWMDIGIVGKRGGVMCIWGLGMGG